MDLFLETPQQKADRILRQQERLIEMGAQAGVAARAGALGEVGVGAQGRGAEGRSGLFGADAEHSDASRRPENNPADYSLEQETYRRELDYDRARQRQRKALGKLRVIALALLVPLGLAVIFLVSYALTCILNGATPEEVVQHLAALGQRLGGVWSTVLQSLPG